MARDVIRQAGRRIREELRNLAHRLAVSAVNQGAGTFFLQYRPDFHLRAGRIEDFKALAKAWTARGKLPHGGDFERLYLLILHVRQVLDSGIEGDLAEVGVYRGVTAKLLHGLAPDRTLYLFDTFEGFSRDDLATEETATGVRAASAQFSDTSFEQVKRFVGGDENVVYRIGRFPETTQGLAPDATFALVHFDADLYEPARAFCSYFSDRMAPGGIMVFHDYNSGFEGVCKAVDEFFADKPEGVVQVPDKSGTAIVVKNRRPAD